jgi:hypothetical protein
MSIDAIPRFMLIDKQGKWIEIRCPMPEMKERLRKYLDKALAVIPPGISIHKPHLKAVPSRRQFHLQKILW